MDRFIRRFAQLALLGGLLFLGGAGYWAFTSSAFVSRAQVAAGNVVDLERSTSSDSVVYHPVVRYRLATGQERVLRGSVGSSPPAYQVGEPVEVLYDPGLPEDARLRSVFSLWGGPLILLGMGGVFAGIGGGILAARKAAGRREEELRRRGTPVQARFLYVERNPRLEVNGMHPWRIVCQWQDPATGKVHLFTSRNLWFDPAPFVQEKELTVFVEPRNPKRYAMDVSFLPEAA